MTVADTEEAEMASRRKMYAEASRTALMDSATECFTTFGYEATSVSQLTDGAQLSKGAFYRHFSDKRGVFIELFVDRLEVAADLLSDAEARIAGLPRGEGIAIAAAAAAEFASLSVTDPVHRELLRQAPEVLGAELYNDIDNEHVLPQLLGLLRVLENRSEIVAGLPLPVLATLLLRVLCGGNTLVAASADPDRTKYEVLVSLRAFFVGVTAPDLR